MTLFVCFFDVCQCGYVHCTVIFIVLGLGIVVFYSVRVGYCIFSYTPYFSHTINISNDQTFILDITGRRRKKKSVVLLLNQHYTLDCLHACKSMCVVCQSQCQSVSMNSTFMSAGVCVCVCVCVCMCVFVLVTEGLRGCTVRHVKPVLSAM